MTPHPNRLRGLCSSFAVAMGVYTRDLFGDTRKPDVARCRAVLAYTLRRHLELTPTEVGHALGVSAHAVHAIVRRIEREGVDLNDRHKGSPGFWVLMAEAFFRKELAS